MKIRFLADADLNKARVNGVLRREPSVDFLTAQAAALRGLRDSQVLRLAAELKRVLVSHDVGTMTAHFPRIPELRNAERRGVPRFTEPRCGAAIDELLNIWLTSEPAEWENRIEWLPL